MSRIFITSDLHLGHRFAAECRGFDDINKHDDDIINTLAATVTKRDVLWVLGDVAMQRDSLYRLGEVNADMRLVRGNHDQYPISDYLQFFKEVHGFIRYKKFWLSHCPIHPQEMYRCRGNIHGHLHKDTASPPLPYPYYNVNWDYKRRPILLTDIQQWFTEYEEDNARTKVVSDKHTDTHSFHSDT